MPETTSPAERPRGFPANGRPRVALVIGSGGIKCAAGVGLWKVLERERIPIDLVVGCSGGSIYTAALALGWEAARAEACTYTMWEDLFTKVHYRSVLRGIFPKWLGFHPRTGILDDRAIWRVMESLYGDATFDDIRVPAYFATTDLVTGEQVVVTEGRIADAVRASIAIPVLLRPWPIGDRLVIDGGASDPLPVSIAIREGADIIIAMGFEVPLREQLGSLPAMVGQATSIAMNNLLRSTYAFYSMVHHAEVVSVMPNFDRPISSTDTSLLPYIVESGEKAAEAELPYLRRLLEAVASEAG